MAGCAPTAAHCCATQRPCHRHTCAVDVPQPSCQSPDKPWGSWWTGWTAQAGPAGDTMPTSGLCLTHFSPSKPPFPPQFRLLDLLPGPLVVPYSPGTTRLCSGLGHARGCAALPARGCPLLPRPLTPSQLLAPAPAQLLRVLGLGSPVLEKGYHSYTPQGDIMAPWAEAERD